MFTTNKNKAAVLVCLLAFIALGLTAFTPGAVKSSAKAEYKNLQVLPKDITKEQLDKIMRGFTSALGVKCIYCHVHEGEDFRQGWDYSKDDKDEKKIARQMLKMTISINSTYFNFENSARPDTIRVVSCNTCHRGIQHPDAKGIQEQMKNMQAPPPPTQPVIKQ
ncbi:MAG: c-type cytochrome [Lacibacter sp.]